MKKIKAITDDCCIFCKEESETIQDLFVICKQIYHCGINSVCTF